MQNNIYDTAIERLIVFQKSGQYNKCPVCGESIDISAAKQSESGVFVCDTCAQREHNLRAMNVNPVYFPGWYVFKVRGDFKDAHIADAVKMIKEKYITELTDIYTKNVGTPDALTKIVASVNLVCKGAEIITLNAGDIMHVSFPTADGMVHVRVKRDKSGEIVYAIDTTE